MPTGLAQNLSFILLGEDKSASKAMEGAESTAAKVTGKIGASFNKLGGIIGGEFGEVLNKVGDGIEQVGAKGADMGKSLMVAGGIATAAGVGLMSLASADKAATDQLKASIDSSGESWDDYKDQIDAAVASGQNFAHEGEDTTKALSALTIATGSTQKALDQMQLVSDLAAQKHISLEAAAQMVAKIMGGGGAKTLTQYGIKMEENADGTKNVDKALSQLAAKLDGQAKASMNNFGAQVDVVKTKIIDWVQEIAGPLGQALTAVGPILTIAGLAIEIYKNRKIAATIATLAQTEAEVAATAATVAQTGAQVGLNVAMDANPIGLVAGALATLAAVVGTGIILSGTQNLAAATADYTATLDANTGAITDNTRAAVAKALADSGALAAAQKLGIQTSLVVDAVMGEEGARTALNAALDASVAKHTDVTNALDDNFIAQGALDNKTKSLVDSYNLLTGQVGVQTETLKTNIATNKLTVDAINGTGSALDSTERKARTYASSLWSIPSSVSTTIYQGTIYSTGPMKAHAAGGIVTSPQMGIVGESGPEAIIPLNAGLRGLSSGGGETNVTVQVTGMIAGSTTEMAKQIQTWLINAFKNGSISKTEFARAIGAS